MAKNIELEKEELEKIIKKEQINMNFILNISLIIKYNIEYTGNGYNNVDLTKEYNSIYKNSDFNSYKLYNDLLEKINENKNISLDIDTEFELSSGYTIDLIINIYNENHNNMNRENYIDEAVIENYKFIIKEVKIDIQFYDIFKFNSNNIKNLDEFKYLYSAYQKPTDITQKPHIWCSPTLDQALLHPFNIIRTRSDLIYPNIFRFKILNPENFYLLNSRDKNNINIFKYIIDNYIIQQIIKYYNTDEQKVFSGEKNYRILLILEIINKFLPDNIKINGYYNYYDQNEIAFINDDNLLTNINLSNYKSIKFINEDNIEQTLNFPIDKNTFVKQGLGELTGYKEHYQKQDLYRMFCHKYYSIKYESFDNKDQIETYICKNSEEYFKQKYLKYKQKYLKLKFF